MPKTTKILAIDDDRVSLKLIENFFAQSPFRVIPVEDPEEGLVLLREDDFSLVISDIRMPGKDGFAILKEATLNHPGLPVIMITAMGSISDAVRAIQEGAYDYLTKPIDRRDLLLKARRAVDHYRLWLSNQGLRRELSVLYGLENIVGRSKAMAEVYARVARAAPTGATVLITGESGTGKELLARAIHHNSPRKDRPFVPVDCAAIPRTLIESELFGHVKGAFTGAYQDRAGALEAVEDGTLFFDEIGDLDIDLQGSLLRALQERVFKRVGENKTRPLAARFLFGTHSDLEEAVKAGKFREDLYYRISVIPIHLPPLRKRRSDIPLLVTHFLELSGRRNSLPLKSMEPAAMEALTRNPWKGNVRELENAIENLVVMTAGDRIRLEDLPPFLRGESSRPGDIPSAAASSKLAEVEREHILRVLEEEGGNRTRTAKALGISLRGLRYKLKGYEEEGRLVKRGG